jgi:O-acetyl-ADP-ribose deacetylase
MITIHQGSILDSKADAIVNPANSFLRHGGGLAYVIDQAAQLYLDRVAKCRAESPNPSIAAIGRYQDETAEAPLIATGNAYSTSAGMLPFKRIIHAVGPIWNGGGFCERSLFTSAHAEAIARAIEDGCESIAFPAISCGIFGFPISKASVLAISATSGSPIPVEFWLYEDEHYRQYLAERNRCEIERL